MRGEGEGEGQPHTPTLEIGAAPHLMPEEAWGEGEEMEETIDGGSSLRKERFADYAELPAPALPRGMAARRAAKACASVLPLVLTSALALA